MKILKNLIHLLIKPSVEIEAIAKRNLSSGKVILQYILPIIILHFVISLIDILFALMYIKYLWFDLVQTFLFFLFQPLIVIFSASYIIRPLVRQFGGDYNISNVVVAVSIGMVPYMLARTVTIIYPQFYYFELIGFYGILLLWYSLASLLRVKENKKPALLFLAIILILGIDFFVSRIFNVITTIMRFSLESFNQ